MALFDLAETKQQHAAELDAAKSILKTAEIMGGNLTPDQERKWSGHMAKAEEISERIEAFHAHNTSNRGMRDRMMGRGAHTVFPTVSMMAPASELPTRGSSLREAIARAPQHERQEVESFAHYLGGDMNALADLRPASDGAVFIPTIIAGVVARNYSAFSPVRDNATIWSTDHGEPAHFPVISDSEAATILPPLGLTGLDDVVSGDTQPTAITGPLFNAYKFSSKPVLVPREITNDASLNVLEEIVMALLSRITRLQNLKYTKGTGTNEPRGYMVDATSYPVANASLSLDTALDLAYSVPALYRPNGVYMASDLTIKYLRKLKDGVARDLWKDAFEDGNASQGTPARLHGYPIFVNNDMDSVATDGTFAGVSPLAFGDFKRFIVREADNGAPYIYRWPVPAKDGIGAIAFRRSDSRLIVPEAISKLTVTS